MQPLLLAPLGRSLQLLSPSGEVRHCEDDGEVEVTLRQLAQRPTDRGGKQVELAGLADLDLAGKPGQAGFEP
jgi:hypothetical protein